MLMTAYESRRVNAWLNSRLPYLLPYLSILLSITGVSEPTTLWTLEGSVTDGLDCGGRGSRGETGTSSWLTGYDAEETLQWL